MKVFLQPAQRMSRAMFRVARALERHAPSWVEVCDDLERADLLILHCIGPDAFDWKIRKPFALIQYCVGPDDPRFALPGWKQLWAKAKLIWSYFDLQAAMPDGAHFYYSPLGIDPIFIHRSPEERRQRTVGVVTSGYVSGPTDEAIEEVALAANAVGMPVVHVGPPDVTGMHFPVPGKWTNLFSIPDLRLASLYRDAQWVSGLRHIEGFELPAIEGLACGARPILFDRPDMKRWYGQHAVYVPECSGSQLVEELVQVLSKPVRGVTALERGIVLQHFAWEKIITTFWARLDSILRPVHSNVDVGADVLGGGAT